MSIGVILYFTVLPWIFGKCNLVCQTDFCISKKLKEENELNKELDKKEKKITSSETIEYAIS